VRVAAIQFASEFGQPDKNRDRLAGEVARAAAAGAQIIVLPETAVTGYADYDLTQVWQTGGRQLSEKTLKGVDPKDAAETVPGPSTRLFSKLARLHGVYVSVPLVEVDAKTGRCYNTVVLVGPTGETLIHYRKVNPWPWAEQGWATDGNLGHAVADTPYGRLGVLVCFDIHKQAAELSALKVATLLYSIAWVDSKGSDWFAKRLPAIAKANKLNIIGANWTIPATMPAPTWHGYGQSLVIDAAGNILAKASKDIGEEMILTDLPLP
jgi:predicted amidohydrolase